MNTALHPVVAHCAAAADRGRRGRLHDRLVGVRFPVHPDRPARPDTAATRGGALRHGGRADRRARGAAARADRGDALRFLLCGFLGIALHALLNTGEQTVSAGAASFIVNTLPIFTALLAAVFLG